MNSQEQYNLMLEAYNKWSDLFPGKEMAPESGTLKSLRRRVGKLEVISYSPQLPRHYDGPCCPFTQPNKRDMGHSDDCPRVLAWEEYVIARDSYLRTLKGPTDGGKIA